MGAFNLKAIISAVDKVTGPMKKINASMRGPAKAMKDMRGAAVGLGSGMKDAIAPVGLAMAGLGATLFAGVKGVVDTASQFEKFETVLTTIEGSSAKAKASMSWIESFAASTPYELSQVTDAFVKLKSYGIDPQQGALKSLGDAAAAMGKPLESMVEALADAKSGEFERLKESLGVQYETIGDDVALRFTDAMGKAQVYKVAKKNGAKIQEAVLSMIKAKGYTGAMDNLSQTWEGMWSNMMDWLAKVQRYVADSGLFNVLKDQLRSVLGVFESMEADGSLKLWAKEVSDALVSIIRPMSQFLFGYEAVGDSLHDKFRVPGFFQNIPIYIRDLKGMWATLNDGVQVVGGWRNVAIALGAVMAGPLVSAVLSVGTAFGRLAIALATNPIGLLIAGIAAGAYLIYQNWDGISAWFSGKFDQVSAAATSLWEGIKAGASQGFQAMIAPYVGIAGWFAGRFGEVVTAFDQGFLQGITTLWQKFNPATLMIDGFKSVVSYLTGWDISQIINDKIRAAMSIMPDWFQEMVGITAAPSAPGGSAAAPPPGQILKANPAAKLDGSMVVRFENAPQGMRVDQGRTNQSGVALDSEVGYRSASLFGG